MASLKMYNCDFGFKYKGVSYDFTHVDGMEIEDPTFNRLIRGSNGTNKEGLIYTEGSKEPKTITVTIIDMPAAIANLLVSAFKNRERIDEVYAIDRQDGSSKIAKNAIICQEPRQLAISEDAESLNVALVFQSFDLNEAYKA